MIINADDFGASRATNEAIIQAIKKGRVNSVSVMTTAPYFNEAANFLAKHRQVAVGLHFNLTEGKHYQSLIRTLFLILFGRIKLSEIERELNYQYKKLKSAGLNVIHLDSHEHLHLFPPIFAIMRKFALDKQIPKLRCSNWGLMGDYPTLKQGLIMLLYSLNNWLFMQKKSSVSSTNYAIDLNWRDQYPRSLPTGEIEVACHLSSKVTVNPLSRSRYACYSYVMGPAFGKILKRYEVVQSVKR